MADIVPNIAKGKIAYYGGLPGTNDGLVLILLKVAEADSVLKDYDTVAAILAGSNTEANFTNYARTALTGVTVTVDDTADEAKIDCNDVTISSAGGTLDNDLVKAIIAYDPDTTTGTDADLVPLGLYDFVASTDGNDLIITMPANGILAAT